MPFRPTLLLLALVVASTGCRAADPDPTVLVRTPGGVELGVSTDHGIVFLGRTATVGEAEVMVWFGDGPSIEPGLIEDMGGGLYTLETPIEVPSVALLFDRPSAETRLVIRGRDANGTWERETRAALDLPASGLLLVPPADGLPSDCAGAGVYTRDHDGDLRLVGLLVGRALVETDRGARDVVCAVGAMDLWRVVTYDRNRHRPQGFPARW